jgi:hypothetical protein
MRKEMVYRSAISMAKCTSKLIWTDYVSYTNMIGLWFGQELRIKQLAEGLGSRGAMTTPSTDSLSTTKLPLQLIRGYFYGISGKRVLNGGFLTDFFKVSL